MDEKCVLKYKPALRGDLKVAEELNLCVLLTFFSFIFSFPSSPLGLNHHHFGFIYLLPSIHLACSQFSLIPLA
jgi:hypothetical protein